MMPAEPTVTLATYRRHQPGALYRHAVRSGQGGQYYPESVKGFGGMIVPEEWYSRKSVSLAALIVGGVAVWWLWKRFGKRA